MAAAGLAMLAVVGGVLLGAVAAAPGGAADPPSAGAVPPSAAEVRQVVAVPAGMVASVDVVAVTGAVALTGTVGAEPLRLEGLGPGTYHLVVRAETPVEEHGDVAISAATASRGDPFDLPAGATLVVVAGG